MKWQPSVSVGRTGSVFYWKMYWGTLAGSFRYIHLKVKWKILHLSWFIRVSALVKDLGTMSVTGKFFTMWSFCVFFETWLFQLNKSKIHWLVFFFCQTVEGLFLITLYKNDVIRDQSQRFEICLNWNLKHHVQFFELKQS